VPPLLDRRLANVVLASIVSRLHRWL